MEAQIVSLLHSRPLVMASEAACLLDASEQEVRSVFAAIANAHAAAYTLLGGTVDEVARGSTSTTKVAMQKVDNADREACVYALMKLTYPTHVAASAVPIQLRPGACDTLRSYPVVSRDVLGSRPKDTPDMVAPLATRLPTVQAVAPASAAAVKVEPVDSLVSSRVSPSTATPTLPAPAAEASPVPSPLAPLEIQSPAPVSTLEKTLKEEPAEDVAASSVVKTPMAAAPRTATIFDKMKEAAATKRPREGDDVSAKAKKAATPKPRKAAKTENTTSLAKLARASKKKAGMASPPPAPSSLSFLDEDDGDAMKGFSNSEENTCHEAPPAVFEEAPVLDVVEVSASNDEVILCDDAPPLAFRPAAPVAPASSTIVKKDAAAKKSSVSAKEHGATQSNLSVFFNPAVVEFQKSYMREMQTEMKVENGEYICVDVPCYKHKATGDVISEEEYHRQTAQLVRSYDANAETPMHHSAGAMPDASPSPAAKSAVHSPGDKTEKSKASSGPAMTLLSFFKPAA
ncbi:hypothetical protein ABL78_2676 [Leptomonas seymouri]|uniref:DNA polymerase delta subunit 3 n=1 Tax=Leptomonas seymouri TaxID=5684 RepID=A0A0N1HYZ0_LEPSE|nr:hypothetical protein ABL78_2676 [Leptomonas seymouri]|eukprot:KPI88252.1 hypothetical protein ABL78_2676 [Leptomonas seymouri]